MQEALNNLMFHRVHVYYLLVEAAVVVSLQSRSFVKLMTLGQISHGFIGVF